MVTSYLVTQGSRRLIWHCSLSAVLPSYIALTVEIRCYRFQPILLSRLFNADDTPASRPDHIWPSQLPFNIGLDINTKARPSHSCLSCPRELFDARPIFTLVINATLSTGHHGVSPVSSSPIKRCHTSRPKATNDVILKNFVLASASADYRTERLLRFTRKRRLLY